MTFTPTKMTAAYQGHQVGGIYRLWVDGVGAYLVCLDNQVRIGGPVPSGEAVAEISLLSNLSRYHARFIRSGEVWLLEPLGPISIGGRPVVRHQVLSDGEEIRLGSSVVLQFRVPHRLSGTARLEFISGHSTSPSVDGVILMAETCVLGPTSASHIVGSSGCGRMLLIRRSDGLWCKSEDGLIVDGDANGSESLCLVEKTYSGANWRFRCEFVR